ncbi:hypothetical protein [Enterobacter hormaechei]|nr:hypothetical protein [Enterobacter hormaechei]
MSELKLNAIDFISFAVAGNTFKLKANLIGPDLPPRLDTTLS